MQAEPELQITSFPPPAGGMSVGPSTGVMVVHLPTGIGVVCTKERSMLTNRDKAIAMLELLLDLENSS